MAKCIASLTDDGMFVGNFDPKSIRNPAGGDWGRHVLKLFRKHSVQYNARQHLLACEGKRIISTDLVYAGADDKAGKNYTG